MTTSKLFKTLVEDFGGALRTEFHLQVPASFPKKWHDFYGNKFGVIKFHLHGTDNYRLHNSTPDFAIAALRKYQEAMQGIIDLKPAKW